MADRFQTPELNRMCGVEARTIYPYSAFTTSIPDPTSSVGFTRQDVASVCIASSSKLLY